MFEWMLSHTLFPVSSLEKFEYLNFENQKLGQRDLSIPYIIMTFREANIKLPDISDFLNFWTKPLLELLMRYSR